MTETPKLRFGVVGMSSDHVWTMGDGLAALPEVAEPILIPSTSTSRCLSWVPRSDTVVALPLPPLLHTLTPARLRSSSGTSRGCWRSMSSRVMTLLESIASEAEYSCQKLCMGSGVSKGTVSHHVKELVRAGLIAERRCGQYMFYEVRREVLAAYTAELMRRVAGAVEV